jgi:hypothetical protein
MTRLNLSILILLLLFSGCFPGGQKEVTLSGELMQWHKVTLSVPGPETSEFDRTNPFLDYRLDVTFTMGDYSMTIPGFYAADGNSAETSAKEGNIWQVRFRPPISGQWKYTIQFRKGKNIAVSINPEYGEPVGHDGTSGSFEVLASDKSGNDFRAKGRLEYTGSRYLQFAGSGEWWIKNGADSPENFLAYAGFDQTYRYGEQSVEREGEANPKANIHHYEPHVQDWNEGDPVWQGDKGKGIIGAVNYLASKGINSQYMLTMNIIGDGKDVWPYSDHNERYRFDCSKLDQWEVVFDHMQKLGIMLHFVLQETENECLLDMGYTEVQRKLYLRELVARFGHHLAVTWNLGEENGPADWSPIGQTEQQKRDMASYLRAVNPYPSFIVLHTHADDGKQDAYLTPLLGFKNLDGASMQIGNPFRINHRIKTWIDRSSGSGHPWVVCLDELGPHWQGIMPDSFDPGHDTVRNHALWGALMAGAGGAEWYFGYRYPHNDLELEEFRSRDLWWDQTAIATRFFTDNLPFAGMEGMNHLLEGAQGYCFARPGEIYAVYLSQPTGNERLTIGEPKEFTVAWFNPRHGGEWVEGTVKKVSGPGKVLIGMPERDDSGDWVAILR